MTKLESQVRVVAIPKVLDVGAGALDAVGRTVREAGLPLDAVLLVRGEGPSSPFAERTVVALRDAGASITVRPGLTGTHSAAEELGDEATGIGASLIVGVGGGRVIDLAKVAALRCGADVVSVPTSIASDGICSPIASLSGPDGAKVSAPARMPAGIVLDTDVVAEAPVETRCAGLGDLLSNLVASRDWRLADRRQSEPYDSYSALIAESAARPALTITDISAASAIEIIAKGLILSGLAMATAGTSRPCSGAEHLISHSLDRLLGGTARLHGQQVALGALVASVAHGGDLTDELRVAFARCGLPTHPQHLGVTFDTMAAAVQAAPATRPGRYTVLSELDLTRPALDDLLQRAFPSA